MLQSAYPWTGENTGSSVSTNGIVSLIRGDTFELPIELNIGSPLAPQYITLGQDDVVELRVFYANQQWENPIMRKSATSDNVSTDEKSVIFKFNGEMAYFEPGEYYYQVKAFYYVEDILRVVTLVPRTQFNILN